MAEISFSSKADSYEKNALVQKSASKILLNLLNIQNGEDVLDLGCGPGNITKEIALITKGRILGVDISEGMINEALKVNNNFHNVKYLVRNSENLGFHEEFDSIYCNSAFQWFTNPKTVLSECFKSLKSNGKIGIQAPATKLYCPNFVEAIEKANRDTDIKKIFSNYKNPWFFLESAEEYRKLFENCGFTVSYVEIVTESNYYTPGQVYKNFQSGAENGYFNQAFYSIPLSEAYIHNFRNLVKEEFSKQANVSGMVELKFNRIYLTAYKG